MVSINTIIEETKRCPSCDKDISVKAKKCPYCQQDLRSWFRKHPILTFLIIWVVIVTAINSVSPKSNTQNNNPSTPTPEKQTTFVASVNFKNGEFIISNLDEHTCKNAKMQVNGDYTLDGYNLESGLDSTVKTGQATVYKVGAGQFTKKDGTRFNLITIKPQNFYIECRGNNELSSAYWYGEFE